MAVKKAAAEKAPAKKAAAKGKTKAGDVYACEVCGLAGTVDGVAAVSRPATSSVAQPPMKKKRAKK